jgi:hypothetical protein
MAERALAFVVQEALFRDMLTKVAVEGNGNCLFYSLLTVAGRPLEDQMSLRNLCAEYLASRWLECPPGSGRRSSTYAARLNDCYGGEPAFRGVNPCFPDAGTYVRYITQDQAWASMSEIKILSTLWRRPIIVWSSDGFPKPGLIGFVADVPPINIVYSNGNHYDALVATVSDATLVAATAALYEKGRAGTLAARANVVDFANEPSPRVQDPGTIETLTLPLEGLSKVSHKRKSIHQDFKAVKKGT